MIDVIPPAAQSEISIHREGAQRMGFFTDTTVCIGCKACEVACKQWNDLPSDGGEFRRGGSYDNTVSLGATTWRHVRFIELLEPSPIVREEAERALAFGAGGQFPNIPASALADAASGVTEDEMPDLVATRRSTSRRPSPTWIAGSSCRTSASTAPTQAAWTRAPQAR
jgi:formate dehydrogenase iron-sulfur subunit